MRPVDGTLTQMKQRRDQMAGKAPSAPGAPGDAVDNTKLNTMDARVQALEVKINKLMDHFGVK